MNLINYDAPSAYKECANATLGTKKSDFHTSCCDGLMINTIDFSWWQQPLEGMDINNFVCCRAGGGVSLTGGDPTWGMDRGHKQCSLRMDFVPLFSLAVTNTDNAAPFLAT